MNDLPNNRCHWPGLEKWEIYQNYHDNQWGVPCYDDDLLFEMFVLESFHCGLSWLTILRKREAFRQAFDGFQPNLIAVYGEEKIQNLLENPGIIRHRGKIQATIGNAQAFLQVQEEFGSFFAYLWGFAGNQVHHHPMDLEGLTHNELSDNLAKDLKKRGFRFMGTVTAFSYLEAVGVMNNHATFCHCYVPEHLRHVSHPSQPKHLGVGS